MRSLVLSDAIRRSLRRSLAFGSYYKLGGDVPVQLIILLEADIISIGSVEDL